MLVRVARLTVRVQIVITMTRTCQRRCRRLGSRDSPDCDIQEPSSSGLYKEPIPVNQNHGTQKSEADCRLVPLVWSSSLAIGCKWLDRPRNQHCTQLSDQVGQRGEIGARLDFSGGLTAAPDCLPTYDHDPEHVRKKCESRRPADVNAGAISARSEWKHKNSGVDSKAQEAKQR